MTSANRFLVLVLFALGSVVEAQAPTPIAEEVPPPVKGPELTSPSVGGQAASGQVVIETYSQLEVPNEAPAAGREEDAHVTYATQSNASRLWNDADDPTIGPQFRVFEPKARVYFDQGDDAPDTVDIFNNGSLGPSINFVEIVWQYRFPDISFRKLRFSPIYLPRLRRPRVARPSSPCPDNEFRLALGDTDWRWGPSVGLGITSPSSDSEDGTQQASSAPVAILSTGLLLEFPLTSAELRRYRQEAGLASAELTPADPKIGVEFGYAIGDTADESFSIRSDLAFYVGISLSVMPRY